MKRLLLSFGYAWVGILETLRKGGNIYVHLCVAIVTTVLGLYLGISRIEWCVIVICMGMVISAEVINTSIECFVDGLYRERHETARKVKDTAAGGVLITAIAAFIVGLIIFLPKVL
jgi:diacylglycerol kinase (ATP)